jgi:signal transduction histidine kinase/CheY-like chemotaxis protein
MALKTVRVPEAFAPLFEQAERVVSRYFDERRHLPETGTIEIFGERYLLIRAASLSVEFFSLARDLFGAGKEREAEDFARNILFDLAHGIGKSDARNFHVKMALSDPIAKLSAGPVHFAHTGWAFVDIFPESKPVPGPDYYLIYDHPYSFESDAWIRAGQRSLFPVCIMNAGYSSGWCEESFGVELVASEVLCRAKGDSVCRFIMAPPGRIEERVQGYLRSSPHLEPNLKLYQIPDFFARKRLEEELRRHGNELEARVAERTHELQEAHERLLRERAEREEAERRLRQAQKMEAIGRLAGGIAHDFNNLLTVVQGYAELALQGSGKAEELRACLGEIEMASQRGATLTRQLLAFSRQQVLAPVVLDLNRLVTGLAGMLRRLIGENIELRTHPSPGLRRIQADQGQLEQVIVNLVVNARDAMPRGGTLEISTANLPAEEALRLAGSAWPPGPGVLLAVSDTGVGMDPEVQSHLFEPFFTTKDRGKGTGLGLATVHGIVLQSRGSILVETAPGRGSIFKIVLPAVEAPLAAGGDARAEEARRKLTGTILLVEDEPTVRKLTRMALEGAGYSVLEAADPLAATEIFTHSERKVELLLTDVVMPHMSGPELARQLGALRPGMKILFMSGYTDHEIDARVPMGVHSRFLQKPYRVADLLGAVGDLIAGREGGEGTR